MGMAASQARYLALTARKTNTEYEGQQINQARTALANQSANLFNRMLSLKVPNPPKTTDYTELQYSYSDGANASVIDSWQQLSSADPNYNYIVNHYYYSNVYTGSQKLLQNPEVTVKGKVVPENYTDHVVTLSTVNGKLNIEVDGTKVYVPVSGLVLDKELQNSLRDVEESQNCLLPDGSTNYNIAYGWKDPADGTWHFMLDKDINSDPVQYIDYSTAYSPTYVGNCQLTELKVPLDLEVETELAQIVKDVPDSTFSKYMPFDPNQGKAVYSGSGIYSFQMNGQTYYACEEDLLNSMQSYDQYGKPIENQKKLPYYQASYVNKRIEETNKALLETDGNGRFKSVKFDNDSITYVLNTETVTDEAAYQDAMNEYYHQKAQYEKTIADINAKTSIIQQEDRTLELRLKQLDTEQLALKTEMEAVKAVIKENVEATFKTFSGN